MLQGIAKGEVSFMVESAPEQGEKQPRRTHVKLPVTLDIIPTPPRYVLHPPSPQCQVLEAHANHVHRRHLYAGIICRICRSLTYLDTEGAPAAVTAAMYATIL